MDERSACTTSFTFAFTVASRSPLTVASTAGWMAMTSDWICAGALPLAAIVSFAALTAPQRSLMSQHDDEADGQMIDRVLDASQALIVDYVTGHSYHE